MGRKLISTVAFLIIPGISLGLSQPVLAQGQSPATSTAAPLPATPSPLSRDPVGNRLLELGKYREAADHYRLALNQDPHNLTACVGLSTAQCKLKNPDQALATIQDCMSRTPDEPELFFARGRCEQDSGGSYLPAAEGDYKKALALDPKHPGAHNQLGLIYQQQGDQPAAMAEFSAAMAADPRFVVAYNNLGVSLIMAGKYAEAIAVLQRAILMVPDLRGVYLYTNLGIAFLYAGKPARAEAAFLMETALNPDYLEAHLNLGNLYTVSRRYNDAIYEYNRVLITDPNHRESLINLGAVYVMIGKPDLARASLEKAVTLYPDSALAHHYLGLAYRALGDTERAAAEDKKAADLGYRPDASPWPQTTPK